MFAAPLPSDGSTALRLSANLLPRGLSLTSQPPKKKTRAAVKPDHFIPRTTSNDDSQTPPLNDQPPQHQVQGVVTRAKSGEGKHRKRYREDSDDDAPDDDGDQSYQQGDDNCSDQDFM